MLELILWGISLSLCAMITAAIFYARWFYGILERTKGLNTVVRPYFIGGSDPFFYKTVCADEDSKRVQKYGKVYGFYEGRAPHIYIADPDLIRLIFIKDVDHFRDKRILETGVPLVNEMMDILPYPKWKAVRAEFSPQLTTGRIRTMSYQMLDTINDWIANIKGKVGSDSYCFDPKKVFTALTTDVIARCAFGMKLNCLDDPNNKFVKLLPDVAFDTESNFMSTIVATFPFLMTLIPMFPKESFEYYGNLLQHVLKERKKSNVKVNDFVDLMIELVEKCDTDPEFQKLGITELTIVAQGLIFLIAGFETTASTLTCMSYRLTQEKKVQEKLQEEVDAYLERHGGKIEHETIGELTYLLAVINETLRMHAPLIRLERMCVKDWTHKTSGLHIKKGVTVQVPVYSVHFDEDNYNEPTEFKPERFFPENKDKFNPYAFLSFGQGPHNCIGMRFAKEELQMTMATILRDFSFKATEDTKINVKVGRPFLTSLKPFKLSLVKRK